MTGALRDPIVKEGDDLLGQFRLKLESFLQKPETGGRISWTVKVHEIGRDVVHIGRKVEEAGDIKVDAGFDTISRIHALIEQREGAFYIQDLESKNGTFINTHKIEFDSTGRGTKLSSGDIIRLGSLMYYIFYENSDEGVLLQISYTLGRPLELLHMDYVNLLSEALTTAERGAAEYLWRNFILECIDTLIHR